VSDEQPHVHGAAGTLFGHVSAIAHAAVCEPQLAVEYGASQPSSDDGASTSSQPSLQNGSHCPKAQCSVRTFEDEQARSQPPQWSGLASVLVSHPTDGVQSPHPGTQLNEHVPALQTGVPCPPGSGGHATPQLPQLLGSLLVSTQLLPHCTAGGAQLLLHFPLEHTWDTWH
jgi:hypothetical protein